MWLPNNRNKKQKEKKKKKKNDRRIFIYRYSFAIQIQSTHPRISRGGICRPILINIAISIDASINHPERQTRLKTFPRSNTATDPLIQRSAETAGDPLGLHNRGTLFVQLAIIGRQVDRSGRKRERLSLSLSASFVVLDTVRPSPCQSLSSKRDPDAGPLERPAA